MFAFDIYFNISMPENLVKIVCGYVLTIAAFKIFKFSIDLRVSVPTLVVGSLIGAFTITFTHINLSMVTINLIISTIFLFSFNLSNFQTNLNPPILSAITLVVNYLYPLNIMNSYLLFDLFLPFLIRVGDLQNVKSSNLKILNELLNHSDTKAILYFLLLNTTFMFIQLVYSFRSGSLGLFSDSLHMALDCSSLALGLVAGILSKSPIDKNGKYPFGYSRFETLAGYTNGTLLVGISGGIIFEAFTRLYHPVELKETNELIVVSILGLIVNLVGIFAFHHDHGGHGHSHGHSHSHSHSHSHKEHQEHSHGHSHSHTDQSEKCEDESMNDNMRGIFLHILADTLGSVGVVISTILTKIFKWEGFDPIASLIIAILIFLSATPLIKSTASALLLSLDTKKEAQIQSILQEITLIKGVKSYTAPRFWTIENGINGYIHIQVYRGENSSNIKKQIVKLFDSHHVSLMIQMEYDYDSCWCRINPNDLSNYTT